MLRIGLTGGIGSGKTTIANIFRHLGYGVYIADTEASRLMNTDTEIRRRLSALFGADIYTPDMQVDKKKMAGIIFNDRKALKQVNRIVHPRVADDFNKWCGQQQGDIVFFETAILFESGLEKNVDYTICVYASPALRIKRVAARDGVPAGKVVERMKNQMDDEEKCRKSDFTICTEDSVMELEQAEQVLEELTKIKKKSGV